MILLIDNVDSFTYNIFQMISEENKDVKVVRNNEISISEIEALSPEAIILSPGPGNGEKANICIDIVKTFYQRMPILGICLGHHLIAKAFGASLTKVEQIKHGKTNSITHNGLNLFSYLSKPLEVMVYHSKVIDKKTLPETFDITAASLDSDEIMAIKHRTYPLYGIQFHPESIGTLTGKKMIRNFLNEIREVTRYEKIS